MTHLPFAVRAALAALLAVIAGLVVLLLVIAAEGSSRLDPADRLGHQASMLAATLDGLEPSASTYAGAMERAAEQEGVQAAALVNRFGRLYAVYPDSLRAFDWGAGLRLTTDRVEASRLVRFRDANYTLAAHVMERYEHRVVLLGPEGNPGGLGIRWAMWLAAGVVALATAGAAWALSGGTERQRHAMERFARKVLRDGAPLSEPEVKEATSAAVRVLGGQAKPLHDLADALRTAQADAAETRDQVGALLQVNPEYVLVCTASGTIIDANPAFYAITGLPMEAIRGGRVEAIEPVLPLAPLKPYVERSLVEGTAIHGIDHYLVDQKDRRRPVTVSLRALHVGGQPAVLLQATDRTQERRLEEQVGTFNDTLELMVDQRVARITAGQDRLETLLDEAGVACITFDISGRTRRWSPVAEVLTGAPAAAMPHLQDVAVQIAPSPQTARAFMDWFWSPDPTPHRIVTPVGVSVVWRKGMVDQGGRVRRVLIGLPLGVEGALAPHLGDGHAASISGDGALGDGALGQSAVPHPAGDSSRLPLDELL